MLLTAATPSFAAQKFTLSSADSTSRFCATKSVTGAGIDRQRYVAKADGFLTARLAGGSESSDWDLAIIDASSGRALNGSAGTSSHEVATAGVRKGQRLWIQACRHEGAAGSVALSTELAKVNFTGIAKKLEGQKVVLVRVKLENAADAAKLRKLGLDLADHGAAGHWDAQLYGDAQQARLRESGLKFTVREADVLAKAKRDRAAERRASRRGLGRDGGPARTSYRTLPEFQQELRALAADNPDIVRLFTLPRRTVEGREILGIEIAEGVGRADDGRPTFVNLGLHHAREWPSAESPLKFAYDLIENYRAGTDRWTGVVRNARTVIIPIVNVDGFDATINSERNNLANPADDSNSGVEQYFGVGAYKRKNCSTGDPVTERQPCILRTRQASDPGEPPAEFPDPQTDEEFVALTNFPYRDLGVDLNRNYGEQWGGPGTDHTRLGSFPEGSGSGLTYHGPDRFSEPEVQAVREFTRDRNISVIIGNHTYTGLILRPPGTSVDGPAEDELAMKELGDKMARETDYISQYGYQLYDTTGTLDDYTYGGLGAYSYTPEIGKENFHPNYVEDYLPEYHGRPRENPDTGEQDGTLGGLKAAYLLAAETAVDASSHSILRGTAPAGRTLKLIRTVVTNPSTSPDDDGVNDQPDTPLEEPRVLTTQVPANGQFAWHVLPNRQPGKSEGTAAAPWRLQCEDGAGNVLESREIRIERGQALAMDLACGAAAPTTTTQSCTNPNGFRSTSVTRRGNGLRISFTKITRNPVTVDIIQTSKGRRVIQDNRVIRFRNRQRSFTWNGRASRNRRTSRGVYYVRFRVLDDRRRIDSRRVVVEKRASGRFVKRGNFLLETRCPR